MEAELFKKKFGGQAAPKQSAILRKKLQGQAKYFDSGDYNMAKSKQKKDVVTGKAFPTVDHLPQRKQSSSRLSTLVDGEPAPPLTTTTTRTRTDEETETAMNTSGDAMDEQNEEQKTKLHVVDNET